MTFRDRIVGFERRKASDIEPHPKNWRIHPEAQKTALSGVLAEVGIVDAVIARKLRGGKLQLVDGHLRRDLLGDEEIPVIVTNLTAAEAKLILTTLDPLAAMAERDEGLLTELLEAVSSENEAINGLLQAVSNGYDPLTLLGPEPIENIYTKTVEVPIYEPTGDRPAVDELTDRSTADELIKEIKQAKLPAEIEKFLLDAAERFVSFNFQRIANYYAHAPAKIQALMERSALVIIDFDKALAYGFARLHEDIDGAFQTDYPDA